MTSECETCRKIRGQLEAQIFAFKNSTLPENLRCIALERTRFAHELLRILDSMEAQMRT